MTSIPGGEPADVTPVPKSRAGPLPRVLAGGIAATVLLLTVLVVVAFEPSPPGTSLDASWPYGLDYGAAHGLAFGRAIVFTFGPLASLYTGFYVPAHDTFYLVASSVLAAGVGVGFLLAADARRRPFLLALPVMLADLGPKDAMFFALPLSFVLACPARGHRGLARPLALCGLAAVLGLLPLVKGTMTIPVAVCVALACTGLVMRRMPALAAALPLIVIGSTLTTWVVSGQSLPDLPGYFAREFAVAAGYTDAMSIDGRVQDLSVYVPLALVVAGIAASRLGWIPAVACLCIAFVGFKAGFVRHDGHAVIAGTTLLLVAYLVFLRDASRASLVGLAAGLAGWALIVPQYLPSSPATELSRFADALTTSVRAIATRIEEPEHVFDAFAAGKAEIRTEAALPPIAGTADIYPTDISGLLASDLAWDPRPVIQSYSAYTPALAALDADHVRGGDAPQHVLFGIDPIDGRYPSLEDGASWPALLSRYRVRGLAKSVAVLDRVDDAGAATIGAHAFAGTFPFDTDIAVPPDLGRVWATIDFKPLKTGRVASLLYKLPALTIEATYADGRKRSFRMIAGMAAGGFLLSPTVSTVRDFLALKAAEAAPADRQVRAFRLHQGSRYPLWGATFDVALSPLTVMPDPAGERTADEPPMLGPALASVPEGGDCAIDTVAGQPADAALDIAADQALVEGWGILSTEAKQPSAALRVALVAPDGTAAYSAAQRTERSDVAAEFHMTDKVPVGFEATLDLRGRHGPFTIRVVQDGPDGAVVCPASVDLRH